MKPANVGGMRGRVRPMVADRREAWLVPTLLVLALIISGCQLLPVHKSQGMVRMSLPSGDPSMLVILMVHDSAEKLARIRLLVAASARPQERVIVIGGGRALVSSVAPRPPSTQIPEPPPQLTGSSTTFQKARQTRIARGYRDLIASTRTMLRKELRQELAAWAQSLFIKLDAADLPLSTRQAGLGEALSSASGDVASLQQAGVDYQAHEVMAIIDGGEASEQVPPTLPPDLHGATVVVDGFPASSREEAAWQADLVQGGARRAVVLDAAADGQLVPVVRDGLDGAITDTLSDLLFPLGQFRLKARAQPQLLRLLRLLTIAYPHAEASVDGYTDDLPARGGNLRLSQRRAQAVRYWLIAHGVAADRLQAAGYGDSDPVAPNKPAGQPRNRRVVIVIDPVAGG
jgi:outer membrane protein OmpA-like peptidoglycan-associated protein